MWEWSNQKHQNGLTLPLYDEDSSLLCAYDDILNKGLSPSPQPFKDAPSYQILQNRQNIEDMENRLQRKLKEFKLTTFKLKLCPYNPQTWQEQDKYYQDITQLRAIFLKRLAYTNEYSCKTVGLNFQDINLLKQGITPENFSVHIKIPFDFGGRAELTNLSLVRTHPTHENLHKIIDLQLNSNFLKEHRQLFIPIFEGKICHD